MLNLLIKINKKINKFLILAGLRRASGHWGVIYDSQTKQPLDPAIAKLIRVSDGEVVSTCTTDLYGRYSFLTRPGKYKILIKKTNYSFPSKQVVGDIDGVYHNIYRGEFFELLGDAAVIPFNIPMDPLQADWNQQAKQSLTNFSPFFEYFLSRLTSVLFWFALVLAVLSFFSSRSRFTMGVLMFYGCIFALALFAPYNRLWGRVRDKKTGSLITNCEIILSHIKIPTITVGRAKTATDGKFFLRAESGRYILQVKVLNFDGTWEVLKTKKIKIGSDGLVNEDIWVEVG
jgi:hypothetical protein